MAPASKAEKKAAVDAAAWMFNVVTSVGIIMVNKALMATYGFSFATTLTGLHFVATTIMTCVLRWLGYIQTSHLPLADLLKFVIFANFSIVGMNISLMWNSVGFYQIAKLSMILVSCLLEIVLDKVRYSRDTKLSIGLVLVGVGVCTVTDVSVNAKGFIAAFVAVWSTSLQQYFGALLCSNMERNQWSESNSMTGDDHEKLFDEHNCINQIREIISHFCIAWWNVKLLTRILVYFVVSC